MAVPALALSAAKITSPSGLAYDKVQIAVVDGTARLSDQSGQSLGARTGVDVIEPDSASQGWLVKFDSGDVWTVTRARGCNCGGR